MELKENRIYRHYKGGEYELMTIGELEHDLTQVVVYKSLLDGAVYVRPVQEFYDKFDLVDTDESHEDLENH